MASAWHLFLKEDTRLLLDIGTGTVNQFAHCIFICFSTSLHCPIVPFVTKQGSILAFTLQYSEEKSVHVPISAAVMPSMLCPVFFGRAVIFTWHLAIHSS
jgi:hypothetical protein